MDEQPVDTRAFLNEIEGHLLLASEREQVHATAARFTASLDWLTEHQRAEVARRFEAEYLALARASWQHTAERAREVRGEYEEVYRDLRRRLLACWLLTCAAVTAIMLLVYA
jgi:hypothetical protein